MICSVTEEFNQLVINISVALFLSNQTLSRENIAQNILKKKSLTEWFSNGTLDENNAQG